MSIMIWLIGMNNAKHTDRYLNHLLARNRAWADEILKEDPEFFQKLSHQQAPKYFWIGCSDSRVPSTQITGLLPGEMFVHRNIANVVSLTDINCLSALQFAVEVLQVEHIIVCGHYGCGGVSAVFKRQRLGLVDHWLQNVEAVQRKHEERLRAIQDKAGQLNRLCELNVMEQAVHVCKTVTVEQAWGRGQNLTVHGWIYSVSDGLLRDIGLTLSCSREVDTSFQAVLNGRQALPTTPPE